MELHQIKYFVAVAEAGSISGAAEICHVSQPSLSQQLAKLEDELGGSLFERSRQGTTLTERGVLFIPRAREILYQVAHSIEDMHSYDGLMRGHIILGSMPGTGTYLLPRLLRDFRLRYPGIGVQLVEESSPDLALALRNGSIDIALTDEICIQVGIEHKTLFTEPLVLACHRDHAFAKGYSSGDEGSPSQKEIPIALLSGEPLIMMKPGHGFRSIVANALAKAGIEPKIVYESGSIETIQALVGVGLGISLVPRMVRRDRGVGGGEIVYLPVSDPVPQRTIIVAWKEGSVEFPARQALRDLSLELFSR